jgi:hypothetical protein
LETSKTHPRLTYATGRNLSFDGEDGRVEGEVVGGFCIWSLCSGEWVFGMEVFLCWFGLGIADCSEAFGGVEVVGS